MSKIIYEFRFKKDLGGEQIVVSLLESDFQGFTEANFGRESTDLELDRMNQHFFENEKFYDLFDQIIDCLIREVTDIKNNDWSYIDKLYKSSN